MQAVFPLSIALFNAGANCSLFVTSSPWPPKPSKILWKGISLKSVAKCFPLSNNLSCCWDIQSKPPLLSITTTIGLFSWKAASIDNPPDKKAPSPLIKITFESGFIFFAESAKGTPTPNILNVPGWRIPPIFFPFDPAIFIAISDQKWVLPPSMTSQSFSPIASWTSKANWSGCILPPFASASFVSLLKSSKVLSTHSCFLFLLRSNHSLLKFHLLFDLSLFNVSKKTPGSHNKFKSAALLSSISSWDPLIHTSLVDLGKSGGFPKFIWLSNLAPTINTKSDSCNANFEGGYWWISAKPI